MSSSNQNSAGVRPARAASKHRPPPPPRTPSGNDGLPARDVAVSALFSVLVEKRPFDDAFAKAAATRSLAPRDRAFARLMAITVLRNRGALQAVINTYLEKPLPEHQGRLEQILLAASAQLLLLETPPHAAISLAVDQCRADRLAKRFANLVNAVLRRISESGSGRLASLDNVALTFPDWLLSRWSKVYGPVEARSIARASLVEPALDISVKSDPELWAERLGGIVLPTGSVRCAHVGRIEDLEGYEQGAWWVQDAAAALPAKLFGDVVGPRLRSISARLRAARRSSLQRPEPSSPPSTNRLGGSRGSKRIFATTWAYRGDTVVADALTFAVRHNVRRRASRRAVHVDRHHPPAPGHPLPQARRGRRRACTRSGEPPRSRGGAGEAGRHARLLHVLARARGRRGSDRGVSRNASPNLAADRCCSTRRRFRWRGAPPDGDLRTLPIHLADLPDGYSRARRILCRGAREGSLTGLPC